jgi:long-subunit acyl-CoA synthetase (AMP-forming)
MLFTPDATGRPRGVLLTHRALAWNAAVLAHLRGYAEGDRLVSGLPLSDGLGLVPGLLAILHAGGSLAMRQAAEPEALIEAIMRHRVTALDLPGGLHEAVLDHAERRGIGFGAHRLSRLAAGAAPLDAALAARIEAAWSLPVQQGYGLVEAGPMIAVSRPGAPAPAGALGPPLPGVEVRILDAHGQPAELGQAGALMVRSTGLMAGYWRDPEATRAAFGQGRFLRTGAIAARDEDGNLTIHPPREAAAGRGAERAGAAPARELAA